MGGPGRRHRRHKRSGPVRRHQRAVLRFPLLLHDSTMNERFSRTDSQNRGEMHRTRCCSRCCKDRKDNFFNFLQPLCSLWLILLFAFAAGPASAQIQQAWVAKYNNGITNGNHQALKMALDSSGNIYVMGISANADTNTGYVVVKYAPNGNQLWAARYDS